MNAWTDAPAIPKSHLMTLPLSNCGRSRIVGLMGDGGSFYPVAQQDRHTFQSLGCASLIWAGEVPAGSNVLP